MALPKGKAAFKKKDGILAITDDQASITWTPLPGTGQPTVSLSIANITNLQQTPDTSPKVMLKIFERPSNQGADPTTYLFHFNSPDNARPEANAVKDVLSRLMADLRATDPAVPKPAADMAPVTNGTPTPVVNAKSAAAARLFDDNHLVMDIELQASLLKLNAELHQTYRDALANKPDSIGRAQFNRQFWSTRTNLLRAHAIESNQQRGAYNVLPTMKTKATQDAETGQESFQLAIDKTQVLQIFSQHPVVKRAYNENVPKPLNETEFWSRFFLSRLCKQLKGERVADTDRRDPIFDKYDASEDHTSYAARIGAQHVPHIIDVEGNEENQGGVKSGNRKDVEMRPRKNVPIIQVLNATSERLLSNVAPTDGDPEAAQGTDDATWRELTLRDLGGAAEENRVILNIKEQSRFFLDQTTAASAPNEVYKKQNPTEVLQGVTTDLETLRLDKGGGVNLHAGIGIVDGSDEEEDTRKKQHVGSRTARKAAEKQILEGLAQSRAELYGHSSEETTPLGVPKELAEKAKLTNGTTTEFLKHFWDAFLSGDPDRAQELGYHAESLRRSLDRIKAIGDEAEQTRQVRIEEQRAVNVAHYKATGTKLHLKDIGGGREAILTLLRPSVIALEKAERLYKAALQAEGLTLSTEND
ncbi:TFIIH p62 subunit domain-containing protein [Coniella lustricola]|uniref:TFIIH p62 subunit domain-containing protein n=1 Tax=Coniella lustricola TaxID=2025994 RepID=A0A2T3A544_9PEZI|nr:TFIIH p62 subunit domain-containing protein [Coniella lustricola]